MIEIRASSILALAFVALWPWPSPSFAAPLESYDCSEPLLQVTFPVKGNRYRGEVSCGNLFFQDDIPTAPVVKWKIAKAGTLYTLVMIDFDGDADGSWPDAVAPGENAPVRHWIVGNIPGSLLRNNGYNESSSKEAAESKCSVLQAYRQPHIPVVSDRYSVVLFEQSKRIEYAPLEGDVVNFEYAKFLDTNKLGRAKASNYFVAVFAGGDPFSGQPFRGHDVSGTWHHDLGNGKLPPENQ